jgi:hypothetical protein
VFYSVGQYPVLRICPGMWCDLVTSLPDHWRVGLGGSHIGSIACQVDLKLKKVYSISREVKIIASLALTLILLSSTTSNYRLC